MFRRLAIQIFPSVVFARSSRAIRTFQSDPFRSPSHVRHGFTGSSDTIFDKLVPHPEFPAQGGSGCSLSHGHAASSRTDPPLQTSNARKLHRYFASKKAPCGNYRDSAHDRPRRGIRFDASLASSYNHALDNVRLGTLPRTRAWKNVIELIANEADVDEISAATFEAADKAFEGPSPAAACAAASRLVSHSDVSILKPTRRYEFAAADPD